MIPLFCATLLYVRLFLHLLTYSMPLVPAGEILFSSTPYSADILPKLLWTWWADFYMWRKASADVRNMWLVARSNTVPYELSRWYSDNNTSWNAEQLFFKCKTGFEARYYWFYVYSLYCCTIFTCVKRLFPLYQHFSLRNAIKASFEYLHISQLKRKIYSLLDTLVTPTMTLDILRPCQRARIIARLREWFHLSIVDVDERSRPIWIKGIQYSPELTI